MAMQENNITRDNTGLNPPPLPGRRVDDRIDREEVRRRDELDRDRDTNPDAITGAPGSHPVGTGIGAAAAGAAGAAIGSVVPGVGTVAGAAVGAVIGAVAGGYLGKGVAEAIDPTAEDAYWRENLQSRPYYRSDYDYESDYAPALWYGYNIRHEQPDQPFNEYDAESLRQGWESSRGKSRLTFDEALHPIEDATRRYDKQRDLRQSAPQSDVPPVP